MNTLWRWSVKRSTWEVELPAVADALKRTALRNAKKRNVHGTKFRWTAEGAAPIKRPFSRAVKEKT